MYVHTHTGSRMSRTTTSWIWSSRASITGLLSQADLKPAKNHKSQPANFKSQRAKKKIPSTCLPRNLPCWVFESINTFLNYTWPRQTCRNALFLVFRISTLLYILYFRLLYILHIRHCPFHCISCIFDIDHSIMIYSTISKITVRPREIGTGGTWGNIKSPQRGPSRFRLYFLQSDLSLTSWVTLPARVSAHISQVSLSPSHYFLSDLMENTTVITTSKSLLGW